MRLQVYFSKHTKFGSTPLHQYEFPRSVRNLALIFGNEVQGIEFLPEAVIQRYPRLFLPMGPAIRSYNLSNVASVGVFEALRQLPHLFAPRPAK